MITEIPTELVGPLLLCAPDWCGEVMIPLATYEKPLWRSVQRGIRVANSTGGIHTALLRVGMTRSILMEVDSLPQISQLERDLTEHKTEIDKVVSGTGRFVELQSWQLESVARLVYLRFVFKTGGAAGHNMVTKAAAAIQQWLLNRHSYLHYVSISGNYCTDKKNSAINGILGRGRSVVAEAVISREICQKYLRTTPEQLVALNIKKNFIGSILSGGVRTANAHVANMLLAYYLALGQDGANVVEGSQGITYAEVTTQNQLYFSVNLPNVIVGSVGNGKHLPVIAQRMQEFSFWTDNAGRNADMLALAAVAVVWAGELSLLAAQTCPGELMRAHMLLERRCRHIS